MGKYSGIIRMRTTILEHLHCARHFAKCFMLEVKCAPNGLWQHNLTKQQQYSTKKSDHRLCLIFVLRGKIDFILLLNKGSYNLYLATFKADLMFHLFSVVKIFYPL